MVYYAVIDTNVFISALLSKRADRVFIVWEQSEKYSRLYE